MAGFDILVIGRGMMGSACARHLARQGARVALIGPDEPGARQRPSHKGPFGSHHDAGRITRTIDSDPDWARLAQRSIARYRALEAESGLPFYTPCGGMITTPDTPAGRRHGGAVLETARKLGLAHEVLEGAALARAAPWFRFAPGNIAALDPLGGHIDPRAYRDAQTRLAARAGAAVIRQPVAALDQCAVTLADGTRIAGGHLVLATGGYAGTDALLPPELRPDLRVFARTVAFAEVAEVEAARLAGMPTLIFLPEGLEHTLYLLPPIRYPDGKLYLKIGGEDDSPRLTDDASMTAWFQGAGSAQAGAVLLGHLRGVMPDLAIRATRTGACAVSFTRTDMPYVARLSPALTLLTGGNGAAAKCADELGRLGALTALGQSLAGEGYGADFRAVLA